MIPGLDAIVIALDVMARQGFVDAVSESFHGPEYNQEYSSGIGLRSGQRDGMGWALNHELFVGDCWLKGAIEAMIQRVFRLGLLGD